MFDWVRADRIVEWSLHEIAGSPRIKLLDYCLCAEATQMPPSDFRPPVQRCEYFGAELYAWMPVRSKATVASSFSELNELIEVTIVMGITEYRVVHG